MSAAASENPPEGAAPALPPPDAGTRPAAHAPGFRLTRAVLLRALGGIYLIAFLSATWQVVPLVGAHGLLPAEKFLAEVTDRVGGRAAGFLALPGVFWFGVSDTGLRAAAWTGAGLAVALMAGRASALLVGALWVLHMSLVHVGQVFWSFGWEILLLETTFLAMFLCPLARPWARAARTPPPALVFWLFRWLAFRVMFGAGLIKLRGDPCWRDLSCLLYHYETQPLPNPLSWLLHQTPPWLHAAEVAWNHFVELIVPWGFFGPRRVRAVCVLLTMAFQATLILSGNLSWLNYLTIVICTGCLDDRALAGVVPARLQSRLLGDARHGPRDGAVPVAGTGTAPPPDADLPPPRSQRIAVRVLGVVVAVLSVQPALNLLSPGQAMNASFDPLHLVNTYGAFGSVGRTRPEIVVAGTADDPASPGARWQEYRWKCKPGDPARPPCVVAPFHLRLDWQIWFAAMSDPGRHAWLVHLVHKLLTGDRGALGLLAPGPFLDRPPRAIRADLYEYRFTHLGDPTGAWWTRRHVGEYLPVLTKDDPRLREFLTEHGW